MVFKSINPTHTQAIYVKVDDLNKQLQSFLENQTIKVNEDGSFPEEQYAIYELLMRASNMCKDIKSIIEA